MKKCTKCGIEKNESDFHKNGERLKSFCKDCVRKFQSQEYVIDIKRAAQRKYSKTTKGKKTEAKYSPIRRKKCKAIGRTKIYENYKFRLLKQKKSECVVCGSVKNIQAHHEDYKKPLVITWLCPIHHAQRHKELRCKVA